MLANGLNLNKYISFKEFYEDSRTRNQAIHNFNEFGFLVIEDVIPPTEIEKLKFLFNQVSEERKSYATVTNVQHKYSEVRSAAAQKNLVYCAESITGRNLELLGAQMMFREPKSLGTTPHQDNFYVRSEPVEASIEGWLPLDNTYRENGGLYVYPRSHKTGVLPVRTRWSSVVRTVTKGSVDLMTRKLKKGPVLAEPPLQLFETRAKLEAERFYLTVNSGSAVFIHGNNVHGSDQNQTDKFRRVLAISYIAEGVSFNEGLLSKRRPLPLERC